jgi:ParB/RepB/Spo0J family partition protein
MHEPKLVRLPLQRVTPSTRNPRLTLDKTAFAELKASIAKNGLIQPIAVRAVADGYEVVGGHRRFHALKELAHENPKDERFSNVPALVIDAADDRVAALRLAENINRENLSPLEVSEGVADALENGMTEEELAASLGWGVRNVYKYKQLHDAPGWFKALATEVPLPSPKLDEHGVPVTDVVTDAPLHEVEMLPGLDFTHLFELLTLYNFLHDADGIELKQKGGEKFRPQAERIVKKLARDASKEQWSKDKLRNEIKRIKNPSRTPASSKKKPAFTITSERAAIDFTQKLDRRAREKLAADLTTALTSFGYETVVIVDSAE